MPCRDYESDTWDYSSENRQLKKQADRLARIACKAMTALAEMGKEDFLLLQDDEVREWWQAHQEADRKEKARIAEKERRERIKADALARLSDEEKELLGLAKPKQKKSKAGGQYVHANGIIDIEAIGESIEYDADLLTKIIQELEEDVKMWEDKDNEGK